MHFQQTTDDSWPLRFLPLSAICQYSENSVFLDVSSFVVDECGSRFVLCCGKCSSLLMRTRSWQVGRLQLFQCHTENLLGCDVRTVGDLGFLRFVFVTQGRFFSSSAPAAASDVSSSRFRSMFQKAGAVTIPSGCSPSQLPRLFSSLPSSAPATSSVAEGRFLGDANVCSRFAHGAGRGGGLEWNQKKENTGRIRQGKTVNNNPHVLRTHARARVPPGFSTPRYPSSDKVTVMFSINDSPGALQVKRKDPRARTRRTHAGARNLRCCRLVAASQILTLGFNRLFEPLLFPSLMSSCFTLRLTNAAMYICVLVLACVGACVGACM